MSKQVQDLESVLQMLVAEHRKLVESLDHQQAAMNKFDLKAIERLSVEHEAIRGRIALLDKRRRMLVVQIARLARLEGEPPLSKLAALHPQRGPSLLKLRDELKPLVEQVRRRAYIAARVAGAVLGHVNTAMRLLAGAVGKAGVYTKTGLPRAPERIGVMNAVG